MNMKIKVTERELKECLSNVMNRILEEGKTKKNGIEKAFKKGNRDAEREIYGDGFKSTDRPHKNMKKSQNKWRYDRNRVDENDSFDLENPEFIKNCVEVKTDLDKIESNIIDSVHKKFDTDYYTIGEDMVDGYFTFIVPINKKEDLVDYLINEWDVNIIE